MCVCVFAIIKAEKLFSRSNNKKQVRVTSTNGSDTLAKLCRKFYDCEIVNCKDGMACVAYINKLL